MLLHILYTLKIYIQIMNANIYIIYVHSRYVNPAYGGVYDLQGHYVP